MTAGGATLLAFGARATRPLATLLGVLAGWEALAWFEVAPAYLLPPASDVVARIWSSAFYLASHAAATFAGALAGLCAGFVLGVAAAIGLVQSSVARRWAMPVMIAGQAAPVFALAPLLTLWLGFGPAAKVVMTTLVVYFPIAANFYDGLMRVDPRLLELARVMNASPTRALWRLRAPAALPALGSGLRLAAAFAPISAVVGEWTGGDRGLGYVMLYANGRFDPTLLFAALLLLSALGVALYAVVRAATRAAAPWAPETAA